MKALVTMLVAIIVIWGGTGLLAAIPAWLLWNWLMPAIFGLPTVTLLQSFGLVLLCTCLIGNKTQIKLEW